MVSKYKAEIFLLKTEGKKNHYPMNIDSSSLHCCCERKRRERETLKRSKRGFFILGFDFELKKKWNEIVAMLSVWVRNEKCVSESVRFLFLLCERTLVNKLGQKDKIEREKERMWLVLWIELPMRPTFVILIITRKRPVLSHRSYQTVCVLLR